MDEKPTKSDIKDLLLRKSELLKKKDFILKRWDDRSNNVQETDKKITILSSIIIQSPAKRNSADTYPGPSSKTLSWPVEHPAAFMKELQDNTYCPNVPIEEISSDWKDTVASCQVLEVSAEDPVAGMKEVQDYTYCPDEAVEEISSDVRDTNASCPVVGVLVEDLANGIKEVQDSIDCPNVPIEEISSDWKDTGATRQNNTSGCLQKLYKNQLPISLAKYKDLKKLCDEGIIPKLYHSDYLNLPHDEQVIDTISEANETEDENIEEDQIAEQSFNKEDRDISLKRKKKDVVEKEIATSSVGRGKGKRNGKGRGKVS